MPVLISIVHGEGEAIGEVGTGRQRLAEHHDGEQAGVKQYGRCNTYGIPS
jgi:hypothetical protein